MNTFDLSLDLDKRAGVTQWVTMRQGDHDGTQLRATIYDHGTQVSDSYTCRVSIRKPTDNEYYRETCSFSGGVAIVTIDEQYAASEVGITYGYFELLQGTAVIASTENFGVRILQSAIDGAIVAPPYDSAIEDALAELDEATGRISQMVIDATAEYLEAHPEITTTVQDNSITDAKLIQKGGILQREQWLETMLPNIPRKTTSEADVHSVTDSAGGGPLGIEVYGRSTQDGTPTPDAPVEIQSVGPNIAVTPYTHFDWTSSRGVTYTQNADGSITAVGTSTSFAYLGLCTQSDNPFGLERGKTYTLATSSDRVTVMTITGGSSRLKTSTVTIPETGNWTVGVGLVTGVAIDETFRFSVFEGDVVAPSAVPYDCVGLLAMGRNQLSSNGVGLSSGVTYTPSYDGTVAMSGTATGNSTLYVRNRPTPIAAGRYVLSGCPAGGSASTWYLRMVVVTEDNEMLRRYEEYGAGVTVTVNDGEYFTCFFHASSGDVMDGKVLRPMLRPEGGSTAYVPYAETVVPIDLGGRSLRSLPDGTRDEVTVDEWGHAILTQRVGVDVWDGSSDENWIAYTYSSGAGFYIKSAATAGYGAMVNRAMCSSFALSTGQSGGANTYYFSNVSGGSNQNFIYPSVSGVSAWREYLAENPVTVLYALAEPVTIDLGYLDTALLPAPDLTAYVVPSAPSVLRYGYTVAESTSSNLAPVETSPATASHAVGTLLTLDGQLVKVTSAIAVGEAVTIGGNVRTTTIAAELAALA